MVIDVATWNVHGFVGADRRRDPLRAAALLRELDPDVIALQEVDARASETFEAIGHELGLEAVAGPALARDEWSYGNLLLSRHPVERSQVLDLSQARREPRSAIDATLDVDGVPVRVLATHLGLGRRERVRQVAQLCDALDAGDACELRVLAGDLNEWRPIPRTSLAPLVARFAHCGARRTFPSRAPLFALDRVLVDRAEARVALRVVASPIARAASDHLPLSARIELDGPVCGPR